MCNNILVLSRNLEVQIQGSIESILHSENWANSAIFSARNCPKSSRNTFQQILAPGRSWRLVVLGPSAAVHHILAPCAAMKIRIHLQDPNLSELTTGCPAEKNVVKGEPM
jgi:hypothetical protein